MIGARIALARGSAAVKTAMSSGKGGILPESMETAYRYIFEYVPNRHSVNEEYLRKVDAVEIKLGRSAKRLERFLAVSIEEICTFARMMGYDDVDTMDVSDPVTVNSEISGYTGSRTREVSRKGGAAMKRRPGWPLTLALILIAPHDWSEAEFLGSRETTGGHDAAVDSHALALEAQKDQPRYWYLR